MTQVHKIIDTEELAKQDKGSEYLATEAIFVDLAKCLEHMREKHASGDRFQIETVQADLTAFHREARDMLTTKTNLILTDTQLDELLPLTDFYGEEILEGSVWDSAPREVLVGVLCEKLTGRQQFCNSEIWDDRDAYEKWLEEFVSKAAELGYEFEEEKETLD